MGLRNPAVLLVAGLGLLLSAGCSDADGSSGGKGATGTAVLNLVIVPSDAQCIQVEVTPSSGTPSTRSFDVMPGESAQLLLDQLEPGETAFSGAAYDLPCASVMPSSEPTWVAASVTATVLAGLPVDVRLTFRRPGVVNVCADFVDFGEDAGECPEPDSDAGAEDAGVEDAGGEDAGTDEDAGPDEDASVDLDGGGDGDSGSDGGTYGDGDVDC